MQMRGLPRRRKDPHPWCKEPIPRARYTTTQAISGLQNDGSTDATDTPGTRLSQPDRVSAPDEMWEAIVDEMRGVQAELQASAVAARSRGAIRVSASVLLFALRSERGEL
jgi:hypothetical protein